MNTKIFHILSVLNFILLICVIIWGWRYVIYQEEILSAIDKQPTAIKVVYSSGSYVEENNLDTTVWDEVSEEEVDLLKFLNDQDALSPSLEDSVTWTGSESHSLDLPDSFVISYGGDVLSFSSEVPMTWYDSESWVSAIFDIELHGWLIRHLDSSVNSQGNIEVEEALQEFKSMIPELLNVSMADIISSEENNIVFVEFKNILVEYISNN